MKFRSERDGLLEGLSTAARASAGRSGMSVALPGLQLSLVGTKLAITGSDQDLTIVTTMNVPSGEDGVVIVPARLLTDIVRAFQPGVVVIQGDDDELQVSSGRSEFVLRPYHGADFPRLRVPDGSSVSLSTPGLADALRQVVRAASSEDTRPVLTGVLVASEAEGLRLVATDSYRLAVKEFATSNGVLGEGQRVLVPSRALSELQRLLVGGSRVDVRLGSHELAFSVGSVELITRLIEGEFPPYQQLIPFNYPNHLVVAKAPFLEAIRRVRLVARDATTPVRISLRQGTIQLTVVTTDWGQATEDLDAKYEGADMTIAFNPQYLADGVEAISGDEVALEAVDSLKPVTLKPLGTPDYIYLLMPVRVS